MPARWRERLSQPVDLASLAALRIGLGALLLAGVLRLWAKGLVAAYFVEPSFFFPHYGLGWLPAPGQAAYVLVAALAGLAACLMLGIFTRVSAAGFCLLFSYAHFLDVTNYLNHYYLVSLLTGLLALSPAGQLWSVDAWRAKTPRAESMPGWVLWLFRFQIGLVYFFAGVAKLQGDWLFEAQPMLTWLAANTDLPLLGPLLGERWFAFGASWLGAAYDLTVPFLLSVRRTRPYAYAAVLAFHLFTAQLFQIGLFPYLMIVNSLIFFDPGWPRRLLHLPVPAASRVRPLSARTALALALYASVQILLPLRHALYPGNNLWTEQGYRFAWRVMLMEKTGSTEFTLVDRETGQRRTVFPRAYLTRSQTKAMATQPDMILAFAHHLAERERAAGRDVAVYVDAFAVLNGRAPARLIDPRVDLARVEDGLAPKPWVSLAPAPDRGAFVAR